MGKKRFRFGFHKDEEEAPSTNSSQMAEVATTGTGGNNEDSLLDKHHHGESRAAKRLRSRQSAAPDDSVCSWSAPPQGFMDNILPLLSPRECVVLQLVCKAWCSDVKDCYRYAAPRRNETNLKRLVVGFPNLTHIDLSAMEGLDLASLRSLSQLSALRSLVLKDVPLLRFCMPAWASPLSSPARQ